MARQVFEGVKVADFSWVAAGPRSAGTGRSRGHRSPGGEPPAPGHDRQAFPFKDGKSGWNRSAYFAAFNAGKYGISLNLRTDRGKAVAGDWSPGPTADREHDAGGRWRPRPELRELPQS